MTTRRYTIRRGAYYDSVMLMQIQRALSVLPGVLDAGVVMATSANQDLLAANDLLPEAIAASPDDLLIVVKAADDSSAGSAMDQIDMLLAQRRSPASQDFRPRSLRSAVKQLPGAGWVLVSVPGRYAAGVAREALELGRHVFLYSDNVSVEDEIALKKSARENGLLVMGPDCGTAIIKRIGLGFANRIRRGPVGLVAASGTGLQAAAVHIHNLGGGISQAIGTGGRDLKTEVGAITAHQALALLAADDETKVIVLISKPPAPDVAAGLISTALGAAKPVVIYFIGYPPPGRKIGNIQFASSLQESAEIAVSLSSMKNELLPKSVGTSAGYVRGLFSGGTLAYETLIGLQAGLSPLFSNAPISNDQALRDPLKSEFHTIIDVGDVFLMVGRLHPMIDNDLRVRRMKQEAADPETGLILFDVVLGDGSHPDPSAELAVAIGEIRNQRNDIEFVSILVGTPEDMQNLQSQSDRLQDAGVVVYQTVAEAVEYISIKYARPVPSLFPPVQFEKSNEPLAAINIGLESFYESLLLQGAQAIHVDWRPPAGGDEKMAALLARMKK